MSQSKVCNKCDNEKELAEFSHCKYNADGRRTTCNGCRNTHRAATRKFEKDYEQLLADQNGCCAICGTTEQENKQRLSIDHSHITYQFRALLCRHCNRGLGAFKDDVVLLAIAIKYLQRWG
jgi:hypothetical protein